MLNVAVLFTCIAVLHTCVLFEIAVLYVYSMLHTLCSTKSTERQLYMSTGRGVAQPDAIGLVRAEPALQCIGLSLLHALLPAPRGE